MGAPRPFFLRKDVQVQDVRRTEKTLQREVTMQVEAGLPGVEVLAVELVSPQRFCVYVDHPAGVDHALCERVTNVLRGYLDRYSVDVSSPGLERPLRKPAHFANAVGRRVALRTEHEIGGRKRFRGEVLDAGERGVKLGAEGGEPVLIPYEEVVRGNVIDEG
jgi:ribosome maturation factor RimP